MLLSMHWIGNERYDKWRMLYMLYLISNEYTELAELNFMFVGNIPYRWSINVIFEHIELIFSLFSKMFILVVFDKRSWVKPSRNLTAFSNHCLAKTIVKMALQILNTGPRLLKNTGPRLLKNNLKKLFTYHSDSSASVILIVDLQL